MDVLKDQVFRFGSKVDKLHNPTLGMYGIGLKRSIFKIGDDITLETHDGINYSLMKLNVPTWEDETKAWDIPFETETSNLTTNPYTHISILNLHSEIKSQFKSDVFINDLIETIAKTYCLIIKENIDIILNGIRIVPYDLYVQEDANYKPSVIIDNYNGIKIKIICFIDPSQGTRLKNAINRTGWNVFCNKRLILANDITELTGWTKGKEDKSSLPKYHSLFNEFRGMVFLEANNPFDLPLNTSKTKLNSESPTYHYILQIMIKAARPIIDYIYEIKSIQNQEVEALEEEISKPEDITYNPKNEEVINFNTNNAFSAPKVSNSVSTTAKISYSKDKEQIDKVKRMLEVKTNREVGEKTFEYYLSMEF